MNWTSLISPLNCKTTFHCRMHTASGCSYSKASYGAVILRSSCVLKHMIQLYVLSSCMQPAVFMPTLIISYFQKGSLYHERKDFVSEPRREPHRHKVFFARPVHVEEVQDMVIDELDKAEAYKLARHYSEYRLLHEQKRRMNTTDGKILSLLERNNEEAKQENANKNPIINSTLRDYMAGEVSRDICRRFLFPEDVISAHDEGIIHQHDMDYIAEPMHNCFSGNTRFITDKGIRRFNEFHDGDSVYVKDLNGDIRLATVHTYGKRKMQKVTFQNCRMERTVVCTANVINLSLVK